MLNTEVFFFFSHSPLIEINCCNEAEVSFKGLLHKFWEVKIEMTIYKTNLL